MAVAPTPSASRGEIVIQPTFFTSSLYVTPLRDDITTLVHNFHEQYSVDPPGKPFTLFKNIWCRQGWNWMHFKVFDSRTRDTFLNVTLRLFLERMVQTEAPFTRTVALFGLYTFFNTQPSDSYPPLHAVSRIPIPIDQYTSLIALPSTLTTAYLLPLQPAASFVVSSLIDAEVFHLLPSSEYGALNPHQLPREIFLEEGTMAPNDPSAPKKKGRPSKRDKVRKAKTALENLDRWMEQTSHTPPATSASPTPPTLHILMAHPPKTTLLQYQTHKSHLLNTIDPPHRDPGVVSEGHSAIQRAHQDMRERYERVERIAATEMDVEVETGYAAQRVARAMKEFEQGGRGLLGLVEGAGTTTLGNE